MSNITYKNVIRNAITGFNNIQTELSGFTGPSTSLIVSPTITESSGSSVITPSDMVDAIKKLSFITDSRGNTPNIKNIHWYTGSDTATDLVVSDDIGYTTNSDKTSVVLSMKAHIPSDKNGYYNDSSNLDLDLAVAYAKCTQYTSLASDNKTSNLDTSTTLKDGYRDYHIGHTLGVGYNPEDTDSKLYLRSASVNITGTSSVSVLDTGSESSSIEKITKSYNQNSILKSYDITNDIISTITTDENDTNLSSKYFLRLGASGGSVKIETTVTPSSESVVHGYLGSDDQIKYTSSTDAIPTTVSYKASDDHLIALNKGVLGYGKVILDSTASSEAIFTPDYVKLDNISNIADYVESVSIDDLEEINNNGTAYVYVQTISKNEEDSYNPSVSETGVVIKNESCEVNVTSLKQYLKINAAKLDANSTVVSHDLYSNPSAANKNYEGQFKIGDIATISSTQPGTSTSKYILPMSVSYKSSGSAHAVTSGFIEAGTSATKESGATTKNYFVGFNEAKLDVSDDSGISAIVNISENPDFTLSDNAYGIEIYASGSFNKTGVINISTTEDGGGIIPNSFSADPIGVDETVKTTGITKYLNNINIANGKHIVVDSVKSGGELTIGDFGEDDEKANFGSIYLESNKGYLGIDKNENGTVKYVEWYISNDTDGDLVVSTTGNIESGPNLVDTSDATALGSMLLEGKTAYVNGEKITGSIKVFDIYADGALIGAEIVED